MNFRPEDSSCSLKNFASWSKRETRASKQDQNFSIELVRDFIRKFLAYQSHYSREKNPHTVFVTLNVKTMYRLYIQYCNEQSPVIKPSSLYIIRDVFNNDFNYHSHAPLKDTCKSVLQINTKQIQERAIKILHGENRTQKLGTQSGWVARLGVYLNWIIKGS